MEAPLVTVAPRASIGKVERLDDARGRYIEFCKGTVDRRFRLRGLKVVVDCANGAQPMRSLPGCSRSSAPT